MSKLLFTVTVPHKGENRRPSFVVSTNNLNVVQISKKGVKLGNTNYNGGFKRFEYSVGGNQAVTKFSLVVNTSALLPHITWATGLPLPIIGGKTKKKEEKRSSSADASSRRQQRPQMGRRASSMDRIEEAPRRRIEEGRGDKRSSRYEDEKEGRRITDGSERRSSRRYEDEDWKERRSSKYYDDEDKFSRREERRSSRYSDDDTYSRRPPRRHDDDRKSRYSDSTDDRRSKYSDDTRAGYKPRLSHSTRYGDTRRYDSYKDRLPPLSEVDAYERKYGKEARRKRYKRQEKYDGGDIVDAGPVGVDADDAGDDGDVGDVGDVDAGDAGGDGGD